MKKIILVIVILVMILMLNLNVFAHEGDVDKWGGHFEKSTTQPMFVLNYHYHFGPHIGEVIVPYPKVLWSIRFSYRDRMKMGTPLETMTPVPTDTFVLSPKPTETIKPTKTETPIYPNESLYPKNDVLPKTGESTNILLNIFGITLIMMPIIYYIKHKFYVRYKNK